MIVTEDNDIRFASAHEALVFAFNVTNQCYDRPRMNRMAAPSSGKGGLSGLESAAQSGMIRAEVLTLSPLHQRILTARCAPQRLPCGCGRACCAKSRPNPEWEEAIVSLTESAVRVLSGCMSHYRLRRRIVESCFGREITLYKVADECGVHRDTAGEHAAKIRMWLRGGMSGLTHRSSDRQIGAEECAWQAIEQALRSAGIVGAVV